MMNHNMILDCTWVANIRHCSQHTGSEFYKLIDDYGSVKYNAHMKALIWLGDPFSLYQYGDEFREAWNDK